MGYLEDDLGNKSMMRKIVWMLCVSIVVWMLTELVAYVWMTSLGKPYEVHTAFILSSLGIVLGGKVTQKGVEMFQKDKKENQNN